MVAVAVTILAVIAFGLEAKGVKVVGASRKACRHLRVPCSMPELWQRLAVPALLLSVIGFVESVSVAQTLAAKSRQRIVAGSGADRAGRIQYRGGAFRAGIR